MTLALAQSFIDSQGKYNHALAIKFFVQWKYQGRFSSSTSAWDVGGSTRKALAVWKDDGWKDVERTQRAITQKLDQESCSGNGSLMRISPVGVALWKDPDAAVLTARQHSLPTHPALACVEACAAFTQLICHAMRGMSFHKKLISILIICRRNKAAAVPNHRNIYIYCSSPGGTLC